MAILYAILFFLFSPPRNTDQEFLVSFHQYRAQLDEFRMEFGGTYHLPKTAFYLFGMGNRTKYLFEHGVLLNIITGDTVFVSPGDSALIIPNEYTVLIYQSPKKSIRISENKDGVWLYRTKKPELLPGTGAPVNLPEFADNRYSEILKVLHQEILINILDSKPLPNLLVYKKPWRRDAAMMAMCLEKTGNVNLIRSWVLGITDPYDHNNGQVSGKAEDEADNLGETLYLVSLFAGRDYPVVNRVLEELPRFEKNSGPDHYIEGRSDFQSVPVYQTKWLIFGLNKLGIKNNYSIPLIPDNYSSLFWWDFRACHVEGSGWVDSRYPYIEWARDHFYGWKNGKISDRDYPLTWEKDASEAGYPNMSVIDKQYTGLHLAAPHSWHAAEIFLYLTDERGLNNK